MRPVSISDFRAAARRRLPLFLFDFIDGGANAEITRARNVEDLAKLALRQRVLRDVSSIDLSTALFGEAWSMPIALGPVGLAGLVARRGEVQAARAAEKAGVPFCLATLSNCPLKEVRSAVQRPFWFQLYPLHDRGFMRELLEHAAETGCRTLVFTVDMPVPGVRYREERSGHASSPPLIRTIWRVCHAMVRPGWAWDVGICGLPHTLGNLAAVLKRSAGLRADFNPSMTWTDLEWIRAGWKGPLVIKGILDRDDAIRAADLGADGIVVSNHGGRQLDGVPSTVRVLPGLADAVGDRLSLLVDGGVLSGLDVVRMLALGARGVLLGRAWIFALAAGGEKAVAYMIDIIRREMTVAMALTGVTRIADIDRRILEAEGRALASEARALL